MSNFTTWANEWGVWHVAVPADLGPSERVKLAEDALREEIESRDPHADPTVWRFPTRVPELDGGDNRVYRESLPCED